MAVHFTGCKMAVRFTGCKMAVRFTGCKMAVNCTGCINGSTLYRLPSLFCVRNWPKFKIGPKRNLQIQQMRFYDLELADFNIYITIKLNS